MSGCVLTYDGKRGTTFSLKYDDATGRQVRELLGPARSAKHPRGWTKTKAQHELRRRLRAVEREKIRSAANCLPDEQESLCRDLIEAMIRNGDGDVQDLTISDLLDDLDTAELRLVRFGALPS